MASVMGFPVALHTPDTPKELRGLARVYTKLVTDVRIYAGALAYCELRLRRGGYEKQWIDARAALSDKWLKRAARPTGLGWTSERAVRSPSRPYSFICANRRNARDEQRFLVMQPRTVMPTSEITASMAAPRGRAR